MPENSSFKVGAENERVVANLDPKLAAATSRVLFRANPGNKAVLALAHQLENAAASIDPQYAHKPVGFERDYGRQQIPDGGRSLYQ